MKSVCRKYGMEKVGTAPYRPQSNRIVERLHGTLVLIVQKYGEIGLR